MGALAGAVILAAENVVDLQFFLMDASRRFGAACGSKRAADALLSSAAALDYALLLASEHGNEAIDDDSPVGASVRDTMTRAATTALDFVEAMISTPDEILRDFVDRYVRAGGLFDTIKSLRERGAAGGNDLAFRTLTVADDLIERLS